MSAPDRVGLERQASGGAKDVSARSLTDKALVKNAPTTLYDLSIENTTGAAVFLQIFDKAAVADVTLGTTVPDREYRVGATASRDVALNALGIEFTTGLVWACTTASGGGTPVGAGVHVNASIGT